MEHLQATLKAIYENVISNEFDRFVLVIGDEGVGKSTLMTTISILWKDILDRSVSSDAVLSQMVWGDRSEFKRTIVESNPQSVIPVMDAARVLHKKESMSGEQVDLQKSILDFRYNENLILLGFQDWRDIPTFMQRRRAKNAFVIPRRGYVKGYNRVGIDRRYEDGEWGDPIFRDGFPPLDGLEIWDRFKEMDAERKKERILSEEDRTNDDVEWETRAEIALKLVKPWSDNSGMNYKEAGRAVGYSDTWVGDRVGDWRRGEFDFDLIKSNDETPEGAVAD